MNQRVLIIDDSEDIHDLVRLGLYGEAVDLHSAFDGPAGIALARAIAPDLILLDVDMPEPDGFEVCRRLKADPILSATPIVFLTGASSTTEKVRGLDLGATDYVTKPFDAAELRARVGAALRTKYLVDLLAQRAMIDSLTGLFNRAHFQQRLEAEMSLARRAGTNVSCLMIDVDHFKNVNDTNGHVAGDQVLRSLAQVLVSSCRLEDVVCRLGGEEFVVLLPNTAAAAATTLAERLRKAIAEMRVVFRGSTIQITCSIGIADLSTCGEDGIVHAADQALYQAKHNGRNQVQSAPVLGTPSKSMPPPNVLSPIHQ
jgi:two-component system, cell cycle response regulator